jgi:hypothetical protein
MDVQTIRLIDVFVIAPILIYASTQERISKPTRYALLAIGIATFVYNGDNYLKVKKDERS